jgi:ATP-dependent helicase HepA
VIADFGFLEQNPKRAAQLLEAGWDLLVVDEAHHLAWTPESASPRYALVEQLAAATPGVILLTATPEQLGRSGHFARLRLLDPQRYHSLEAYLAEAEHFQSLSRIADKLLERAPLETADLEQLQKAFDGDATLQACLADPTKPEHSRELLAALIDRHGTGRSMFRNRRANIGGFPKRVPAWELIDAERVDERTRQALLAEFHADIQQPVPVLELDYASDPRIDALVALLDRHPQDKVLLICRSQAKVLALEEA